MSDKQNNTLNIAIVGLGGQGVITLAKLIANTSFMLGKKVCYNEMHGLSQRGGSVQSFIRINEADNPLFAAKDVDIIIGLEKLETLRYLYLARETKPKVLVSNKYDIRTTVDLGLEMFPDAEDIDREIIKYSSETYIFDALGFEASVKFKLKPVNVAVFSILTTFPELEIPTNKAEEYVLEYLGRNILLKQVNKKAFKEGLKWMKKVE
ncbi:MAG: 2-oxoacid:acceptor oxidoreductase family protein [Candidatus Thorarchaeota archaeon]